jgi:hypothetical protein
MADRLIRVLGASLALVMLSPGARAQMADPTRPPPGVSVAAPEAEAASGPVLQSVLIPGKGKPWALIGGQQVSLGGWYGESRLIRLTEREAVLEGPAGVERLLLTPDVEKTNIVTKNVPKAPASRRAQDEGKP